MLGVLSSLSLFTNFPQWSKIYHIRSISNLTLFLINVMAMVANTSGDTSRTSTNSRTGAGDPGAGTGTATAPVVIGTKAGSKKYPPHFQAQSPSSEENPTAPHSRAGVPLLRGGHGLNKNLFHSVDVAMMYLSIMLNQSVQPVRVCDTGTDPNGTHFVWSGTEIVWRENVPPSPSTGYGRTVGAPHCICRRGKGVGR